MTPRVALVTGAARGQGRAITQRLRADGFLVAACDIDAVDTAGDDGVIGISLDVTSESAWKDAVTSTVDRFGALSTLVNNAGILHRAPIAEESAEGFERSWRVNCLGTFLGIRAALEQLRAAEDAAIVNIATPMLDAETQARLAASSAFGRIGEPSEVADAVAFLVSSQASFITGSELVIDGGQCLKIQ
jgi:3alpha(or 20beta)-hydroxysteroid dehydrogenase